MLTSSRRYREHSLQLPSLELTGDSTAQINEDVMYKRLLYQENSVAGNAFCMPFPCATGGSLHPSPGKMVALNHLPSTVMNSSTHQFTQCSKVSARFEKHCIGNMAPLTHHVSKDTAFTTAASAGKCVNMRHVLHCKYTWAIRYKL